MWKTEKMKNCIFLADRKKLSTFHTQPVHKRPHPFFHKGRGARTVKKRGFWDFSTVSTGSITATAISIQLFSYCMRVRARLTEGTLTVCAQNLRKDSA